MMAHHLILMHEMGRLYPQEWPAMVPLIEYLMDTAPQEPHGLSAHDVTVGFAVAAEPERSLAPFLVPRAACETDTAARLFARFREAYGFFQRAHVARSEARIGEINRKRLPRWLDAGDVVFRRMPAVARSGKHLFPERADGPFRVLRHVSASSVLLWDDGANLPVSGGNPVPLDQVIAGPRRTAVDFDPASPGDARPWSELLAPRAQADAGGPGAASNREAPRP